MKKFILSLFILLIICVTFSGCSNSAPTKKSSIEVGLSTDEGGLNDKSFNQSANTGILKAKDEFNLIYKPIESTKKEDYEPNLQALVENGSDLIFGVGFQMGDAMTNVSKKNPKIKFAIIDSVVAQSNVLSINFKE